MADQFTISQGEALDRFRERFADHLPVELVDTESAWLSRECETVGALIRLLLEPEAGLPLAQFEQALTTAVTSFLAFLYCSPLVGDPRLSHPDGLVRVFADLLAKDIRVNSERTPSSVGLAISLSALLSDLGTMAVIPIDRSHDGEPGQEREELVSLLHQNVSVVSFLAIVQAVERINDEMSALND